MKCRQIVKMIDEFLDKKLEPQGIQLLNEHLEYCESCNAELHYKKELFCILGNDSNITAPGNFTDNVMNSLPVIKHITGRSNHSAPLTACYPFVRRLGVSMILTAAVMLFGVFLPPGFTGTLSSFAAEKTDIITEGTYQLSDSVDEINQKVKTIIKNINDSLEMFKEE